MKKILLIRTHDRDYVSGRLFYEGFPFCYTLERPWLDNKKNVSCIPEGTYTAVKRFSLRFARNLFELQDVPGRQNISIHAGNTLLNTDGCVLVGSGITCEIGTIPVLFKSKIALDNLMELFKEDEEIEIEIKAFNE